MKITLATHVIAEVVGEQLFVLHSSDKQVYSIPLNALTHYDPETKTLEGDLSVASVLQTLCDKGLAVTPGRVSRRVVVGSTGAMIGGVVAALSLPAHARASSDALASDGEPSGSSVS